MPEIKDRDRFKGAIGYFILAIIIIVNPYIFHAFHLFPKYTLIYPNAIDNFRNYPRLLWCVAFSFLGFSYAAYRASKTLHEGEKKHAKYSYFTIYPRTLLVISIIVFTFLHLFNNTSNYLFYVFSLLITFLLSKDIDTTRTKMTNIIDLIFAIFKINKS
jgi:hypothetical protein